MLRKVGAAAGMVGAGSVLAREAFNYTFEWMPLVLGVGLGVGGLLMTRRSVVAQVMGRAAAWSVFLPFTVALAVSVALFHNSPAWQVWAMAGATGGALFLTRDGLTTKEARESFAPKAFRRLFLTGAMGSMATAFWSVILMLESYPRHMMGGTLLAALAASSFASAVGILRMRAWGLLLGMATSVSLLAVAAVIGHGDKALILGLASLPGLAFQLLPLVLARLGVGQGASSTATAKTRIADAPQFARYRIASDAEFLEQHEAERPRAAAAAR